MRIGTYVRQGWFAAYATAHAIVGIVLFALPTPDLAEMVWLLLALPFVAAFGAYQAEIALNEGLDEAARTRWRIAFYFPWSMALYWWLEIRPLRDG